MEMESVGTVLRVVHITAAIGSFALLGVPLVAKKGGALHRRVGWAWTIAMAIVIATGAVISSLTLAWPTVMRPDLDPDAARRAGLFLLLIGAMSASAVWQGIRAIARKRSPAASRHPVDIGLPAAVIVLAAVVLVLGLVKGSILLSVFGAGAAFLTAGHLRFAWRPLPSKMAWWYGHMNGMLGAVIAAVTAFSVSGLRRFVDVPDAIAFLPWILPGVVLGPAFGAWQRYYRRRFGESDRAYADAAAETA
jgi:hypothetical protein